MSLTQSFDSDLLHWMLLTDWKWWNYFEPVSLPKNKRKNIILHSCYRLHFKDAGNRCSQAELTFDRTYSEAELIYFKYFPWKMLKILKIKQIGALHKGPLRKTWIYVKSPFSFPPSWLPKHLPDFAHENGSYPKIPDASFTPKSRRSLMNFSI